MNYYDLEGIKQYEFHTYLSEMTGKNYYGDTYYEKYEKALIDYHKIKESNMEISEKETKLENKHMGNANDLDSESDNYGYSMILLSVGSLISGLSLIPERRKIFYTILVFASILFLLGIISGGLTLLGVWG